ncbi:MULTISPECIES: NAD(P)-dependent oxidoreductase [unclassified Sphingobacterium]|uniref:NAD(P)-dependent oxidoreductase n=1 Tax=unclassified Sphingobacterium TaxID=2609468 RepID=UPI001042CA7B|nr:MULTISPECIES: NAD(P)-dependent oxidoreductase [unclassified Sphingobacterium]MBB2953619.1 3-hydroxyisobutyrate dehydrogenase [Sphingobacterium sp. JUb56]MCS3554817.1 3-hydroxyisobutyrate dehydrogenase [Sphingobacterium sp. JUb21]NJI73689.1 NAD(P)-dependent oxidoreductase [Sphingobacterium sp. B16(2022)]TCR05786.1 3-hydroxyisobutyrate dehydrogenase [Sphingobacterium sp. JUb20]
MHHKNIGWIGLGNMGFPMAKNLENAGFPLSVFNRTPSKSEPFTDLSEVYISAIELVKNCDIIFTMVSNDAAIIDLYEDIFHLEDISGKIFIDMSTISKDLTLTIAQKIQEKQARFMDAPVAGSTVPAKEGTLIIMAGGEEKDLQEVLPYLNKLGKAVKHVGPVGSGISAKLAINYFLSIIYQGLAETVLFAEKSGIKTEDMLEIINESACGSGATKVKTPLLLQQDYPPAFALDFMLKDLNLAKKEGVNTPMNTVLLETYQKAHDAGLGKQDVISIINYLKQIQ